MLLGLCPCYQRIANIEAAPGFGLFDPVTRQHYIMAQHRVIEDDLGPWCEGGENITVRQPEVLVESRGE